MVELKEKRKSIRAEIQRCKYILELEKQPGWKQLMDYYEYQKTQILNQLTMAPSEQIKELQERYKAYNSVTSVIRTFASVRDNYLFELEQLAESQDVKSPI